MSGQARQEPPSVLVVMGVSGSGKTTVAALLAGRLNWEFADGDDFHPPANVEKMHSGVPLTDDDRWPWLDAIAAWIDATRSAGGHGVVACSALMRRYRDVLLGSRPDVRLVYLRVAGPHRAPPSGPAGHFMPRASSPASSTRWRSLVRTRTIVVSVEPRPREIVARILSLLHIRSP